MEHNDLEISFYEKKDPKDLVYNELKKYEKDQLKAEFDKKSENYEKNELKKGNLNLDLNPNIISEIINNEDSEKIYKQKVINEIVSIQNDDSKFKIDYLTILLVGRKGVGKTTLINYILKLPQNNEENKNKNHDNFVSYHSQNVPHLKLVEFRGIGLDKDSNPEKIGNETIKYINDHIKKKKKNNYNDFVHCIWYCITSTRFEKTEIQVLKKLKQAYKDNTMPIIVVYTQALNNKVADEMYDHINKQNIETMFVKVLADDVELMDNGIKPAFGEEELLNKTLEKCTKSLEGEMINLMTQKISDDIKSNMLSINRKDEEKINNDIINNFVEKYKNVLKDEEFIKYIINMLVSNLQSFYKNDIKKISNSSYNLVNNSDIINKIKNFISYYKKKTKEIIEPIIKSCAIDFIDKQASLEKNNCNILIANKRRFKGFKRTNEIYLKKSFYYISQKYIINYLIENFCGNYFSEFRKKFDIFIKNNLEKSDEEIKYYLEGCFLTKLKKFADNKNISVVIKHNPRKFNKSEMELPSKNQINGEEELYKNEINTTSFDLGYKYNDSDNENGNEKPLKKSNINLDWFPLKEKSWKYINKEKNLLNDFLQKIDIQDSYLSQNTNDEVYKSFKEYIKNDLTDIFNSRKVDFIKNKINSKYNTKKIEYDKAPITEVIEGENIFNNYKEKIRSQFDIIENNNDEFKIDYLTIILVGKSGAGKSALINSMILENLAEEGAGDIVTKIKSSYRTEDKIPFLRFIDTRGIELNNQFGPVKILKDTHEYINNQKTLADNNNNYNNYIQCLWYCVKDNNIEPKEIEIIKDLKKNQQTLPLIIVSPNTFDKKKAEKMKRDILQHFDEDIEIISVLGKDIEGTMKNYGRDELLNKTLEVCQKAVKGDIFNKIKMNIKEKIINIFNKINMDIKKDINIKILTKFIGEYKNVLTDQKLSEFIFDLLEINFVEYIKSYNQNETKHLSTENKQKLKNSKTISTFIDNFIKFYKKKTQEMIEPILEDKELEYLDIQVKKEIKEFGKSIKVENKNDKKDFKFIIEKFLSNNFYYISQKYIIYHLITDVCESYSEDVENEMNNIVKDILEKEDANKWFKGIYNKKFEDFKEYIDTFRHNGKIYKNNMNNENIDDNREIYSPSNNKPYEIHQMNFPEAPNYYPKF